MPSQARPVHLIVVIVLAFLTGLEIVNCPQTQQSKPTSGRTSDRPHHRESVPYATAGMRNQLLVALAQTVSMSIYHTVNLIMQSLFIACYKK